MTEPISAPTVIAVLQKIEDRLTAFLNATDSDHVSVTDMRSIARLLQTQRDMAEKGLLE